MSADNILLITHEENFFRLHDVNFSDISSHWAWKFPLTDPAKKVLREYLNKTPRQRVGDFNTLKEAEIAVKKYIKNFICEYGYGGII